jgi:large subunit ribosomal protein L21
MLAVIKTGGKQYKVKEGDKIEIEKNGSKKGDVVLFEEVLLVGDENDIKIGNPFLKGVKGEGEVLDEKKSKKVKTVKHKAKKRYLVRGGHRQEILEVKITGVNV